MQSGNGIDLAAIHQLLIEVAQSVRGHDRLLNELVVRANDHARTLGELVGVVNGHSRKIDDLASEVRELRLAVNQYHDAVIGHGIELTQLGDRVKRIEEHLDLNPATS
jgi:hypothetical protein